jgi:hypothetical protein
MHLTDEQLNEYLDNASTERALLESHLDSCDECAARLSTLQALFTALESLPEVALSTDLAARFTARPSLVPRLPRWLILTATLQAALALLALIATAPFIANRMPPIETPPLTETLLQLQARGLTLLEALTHYQIPALPQLPSFEISSLMLSITLAVASLLWLVGNGLLLRKQLK